MEQLSQGKFENKKCIRKTKKMRDTAFENYFKIVYPQEQKLEIVDDDHCFEKGVWVGPACKSHIERSYQVKTGFPTLIFKLHESQKQTVSANTNLKSCMASKTKICMPTLFSIKKPLFTFPPFSSR